MAALHFTKENFQQEVMEEKGLVLVDFWAPWCGPCQMFGPIVDEAAEKFAGKVKIGKVNVDEDKELAKQFRVFSIPTVILVKDGEKVHQSAGAMQPAELEALLNEHLA